MRFTPVSEEQAAGVWPKGEYDALVTEAVEKTSKSSNNPMIELTVLVYGPEGKEKSIRDWLVSTDGGQAKIQRFCKSAGLWDMYQAVVVKPVLAESALQGVPASQRVPARADMTKPPTGDDIPF
jgi:hypothetical protein